MHRRTGRDGFCSCGGREHAEFTSDLRLSYARIGVSVELVSAASFVRRATCVSGITIAQADFLIFTTPRVARIGSAAGYLPRERDGLPWLRPPLPGFH